jgi:ABC-type protease/lipase transport system fused ATPase/permease subunit
MMLRPKQGAAKPGSAATPAPLQALMKRCKGPILFAMLFSGFINLLMLAPSLYMMQIYDRVLQSRSETTLVC